MNTISGNPYSAISDPTRREILDQLAQSGPLRAGLLAQKFSAMSRPAVSKHLRILRNARLVRQEKRGREIWYFAEALPLQEVYEWMKKYEGFWANRLTALKNLSEERNNI